MVVLQVWLDNKDQLTADQALQLDVVFMEEEEWRQICWALFLKNHQSGKWTSIQAQLSQIIMFEISINLMRNLIKICRAWSFLKVVLKVLRRVKMSMLPQALGRRRIIVDLAKMQQNSLVVPQIMKIIISKHLRTLPMSLMTLGYIRPQVSV